MYYRLCTCTRFGRCPTLTLCISYFTSDSEVVTMEDALLNKGTAQMSTIHVHVMQGEVEVYTL